MSRLLERIENFHRAFKIFNDAVIAYNKDRQNELTHMALIQSFEIVFELGWKILKDKLKSSGIEVYAPKDTIKEAFSANILPNAQIWIDMLETRNLTSHEYNMDKVDKMLENVANVYFKELTSFSDKIKDLHD